MTRKKKAPANKDNSAIPNLTSMGAEFDQAILAQNLMKILPLWQDVMTLIIEVNTPKEKMGDKNNDPFGFGKIMAAVMGDMAENPVRYMGYQQQFWQEWMDIYSQGIKNLSNGVETPDKIRDRRFKNEAWSTHPFYDFMRKSYGIFSKVLLRAVDESETIPPKLKARLDFFSRQIVDALSPANNPLTNPEVIDEIAKTSGENLLRGLQNLKDDLENAHGSWTISTTPKDLFKVGRDVATTKGHVIYRNDMMEVIEYTPVTKEVHKTPLLIVAPWINKFYILDLRPDNSFIQHALAQGQRVFLISWKNPDGKMRDVTFKDYMHDGVLSALTQIEKRTGEASTNVLGYCIGGTLLTMTLAWLKAKGQDKRINKATFLTTLIDFKDAGDLSIFIDDDQVAEIEKRMAEKGYLDGKVMQATFAMLRANDMIWSYVVNNYWMGRDPAAFDMLFWNSDVTNLPAAFHSDYLRSCYIQNKLAHGQYELDGVKIDVSTITTPSYFLSAKDDHIAPWKATYKGARLFNGDTIFTLSGSGHVAGVVNPPAKNKYGFWTSSELPEATDEWLLSAKQSDGSWWSHWTQWLAKDDTLIKAPTPPSKPLCDAPGTYVL